MGLFNKALHCDFIRVMIYFCTEERYAYMN